MSAQVAPATPERPRTVLVVDDEELNRHLYGSLLSSAGYQVEVARDGQDAIEQLESGQPDMVLLDFRMPLIDGPGVLRWMRGSPHHLETPVVLLTASGEAEHVAEAFDAGADDYLLKPVNPRILLARVRSTIQAREISRSAKEAERRQHDGDVLRERLIGDLEDARLVQLSQIPEFPIVRGGAWFSGYVASSGHVGGDLVDVIHLEDGGTAAVLLDVAGHGTGAALVASAIRSELRFLLASHDPERALVHLGRRLLEGGAGRHVCVGIVTIRGDALTLVNAGLPPIWVGSASTPRLSVESSGPPPGLFESDRYSLTHATLQPGEIVALLSDGLTEPFGFADETGTIVPALLDELSIARPLRPELLFRQIQRLFRSNGVEERPDDATALFVGRGEA